MRKAINVIIASLAGLCAAGLLCLLFYLVSQIDATVFFVLLLLAFILFVLIFVIVGVARDVYNALAKRTMEGKP